MALEFYIIIISTILAVIGIRKWEDGDHLSAVGRKVNAIVFKNEFESTKDGIGVYYPVIRFLTEQQIWITQKLDFGCNPPLEEGTKLEVIYDPDDPTDVSICSTFLLGILPRVFVAVGICGLVFSFLELFEVTHFINN